MPSMNNWDIVRSQLEYDFDHYLYEHSDIFRQVNKYNLSRPFVKIIYDTYDIAHDTFLGQDEAIPFAILGEIWSQLDKNQFETNFYKILDYLDQWFKNVKDYTNYIIVESNLYFDFYKVKE